MNPIKYQPLQDKKNIEHVAHGKCMCEVCNCGKHKCPDGKHDGSVNMGSSKCDNQSPDGKYKMIQKNFILPQDKFSGQSNYTEQYNRKGSVKPVQKFIPKSQLELSKDPFQASTSYIEDYLNRGQGQRTQKVLPPKNIVLPEGRFDGNSSYQENYIGGQTQRQPLYKPTGELKIGGAFEGSSSYVTDYENKGVGARSQRYPLPKNQVMPQGRFQATTNYTENFVPGKIQRNPQYKPESSLKVGGNFQGTSSYEADFNPKMGQRSERYPLPQNKVMPDGKFQGNSVYNSTYIPGKIEKQALFKPEGQLKIGGEFKGSSSYLDDYANKGTGLRAQKSPLPKNQVLPQGRFEGNTSYAANYVPSKTDRQPKIKPEGELKIGGQFHGASSYGQDYQYKGNGKRSERVPLPRNQFMPQGRFQGNSSYNADYIGAKVQRNPLYKPVGQLKVGQGKFEGSSIYLNDYEPKGKPIRSQPAVIPDNKIIPEGRFEGNSAYTLDYVPSQIQKSLPYKPVPQLNIGGKFQGNSTYQQTYTAPHQHKKENCLCDELQAPKNPLPSKGHIRYNHQTGKWE